MLSLQGYGFITFSSPAAAEQAMLMFNNYALHGSAIHVSYSRSATAKARLQALRQARRTTLATSASSSSAVTAAGTNGATGPSGGPAAKAGGPSGIGPVGRPGPNSSRYWSEAGVPAGPGGNGVGDSGSSSSRGPTTPTGGVAGLRNTTSFDVAGAGQPSLEALSTVSPLRHSVDFPGYTKPITPPAPGAAYRRSLDSSTSERARNNYSTRGADAAANPAAQLFGLADTYGVLGGGAAGAGGVNRGHTPPPSMGNFLPGPMASNSVYVAGLPPDLEEDKLLAMFNEVAPVANVRKPRGKVCLTVLG